MYCRKCDAEVEGKNIFGSVLCEHCNERLI